jgi:pyrimidine operon attenuation protein/uracil phosphoribosyltransferase
MPDVIQKAVSSNSYKNGTTVVSISPLGIIVNNKIDPKINQISQITTQSGVLDSRFDDVRYYSGDTSA